MFSLLPREEKFFDLFEQQAGHIVSASRVLEELTLDYPDAKAKAERIKDIEHAGDTLTHEIVRRLNTTFVTPIDREDIYAMASRLDDVLDSSTRWLIGSSSTRSTARPTGPSRWPRSS